jgi:hypothetical protein
MKQLLTALAAAGMLAAGVSAQALTSLTGTVTDPTGAVVPGATISIVNDATHANRQTVSDAQGRYSLLQVEPGTYAVTAKAQGFAEQTMMVRLLVNTPATLPIAFESLGAVSETVSVSGVAPQINTTDASVGNAISSEVITQVPLEGRNVVGLLALQPGVVFLGEPDPGTIGDHRSGAVNGGKTDQANVTLDGVDVNDQQSHTAFTSVLRVTLDSVEEFRTVTTNSGADMGRTSGAQVALVTKSGTNLLHGSLYEVNRNTDLEANDFFNNSVGNPRTKLIRNVFGGAVGGPIKKDRLFFFLNYEGRRDASSVSVVRTVPTQDFRNGIFTYKRKDGSTAKLSPAQVTALDPAHIGPDQAVLSLLNTYPLPNDRSVGDKLNTLGYRFNAPVPLSWNTYIARFNWQVDSAGKHQVFWRGNLQNDDFVPNLAADLPFLPGGSASRYLDNNKGLGAGYNALISPNLTSSFRYGFTRQSYEQTGLITTGYTSLRNIDTAVRSAGGTTRPAALARVVPAHTISEDLAWAKGGHNVTFGAEALLINNRFTTFAHSFSSGYANSSVLLDGGLSLLAPDAANSTAYKRLMVDLLGVIPEADAQYNYDTQGNVLPQGTGVARSFIDHDYEFYGQDSWKIRRNLTFTAGLRFTYSPPIYEANGIQASPNIPLGDWFNQRGGLAAQGKSQMAAGLITLDLLGKPSSRELYNSQKDWAPRAAIAWSPHAASGLSKFLFGGEGKTSIRAGYGLFYDLFGQGVAREFDNTELGFSSSLPSGVSPANPLSNAATAPRFTGLYNIPTTYLAPAPKGGFPQTYPTSFAVSNSVDQALKTPYTMNIDFSIGRELGNGFFVQGSYIGRLARHSLAHVDLAMPTNLVDTKSGQTYFQGAQAMSLLARQNGANGVPVSQVKPIPFFENLFPGYADPKNGLSATQVLYRDYFLPNVYNETTAQQLIDDASSDCSPCSILGPNAMYSPQFAALSSLTSIGGGSYHAMQWTVRKRFSADLQFDFNWTWSKSIDLASYGESFQTANGSYTGLVQNAWFPRQYKGVSDYDTTHLFSAFVVYQLPVGRGKSFLKSANPFVNAVVGGWQVSAIWHASTGFPISVGDGGNWPTDWQLTPVATQVGPSPVQQTTKNGANGGPNIFANPAAALASYDFTLPGESGQRNGIRGQGLFSVDLGLGKRFTLFTIKDRPHTLQVRGEAFNVTNTVRFDPAGVQIAIDTPSTFGNYTNVLGNPRVIQLTGRFEF